MGRALELYESLGDKVGAAVVLNNLAAIEYYMSRWDRSAEYFAKAVEASTMAGDRPSAALAQINLGEIRVNQGRLDEAKSLIAPALRTMESFGYRLMVAAATMQLARVRAFLGELDGAVDMLDSALATFDEIGSFTMSVEVRARLVEVLVFGGRLGVERSGPETPNSALVDRVELTLDAARGNGQSALAGLEHFLDRARKLGAAYEVLVILVTAARLGVGDRYEDPASLQRELGVVRLPMLPSE
jgi:tetratricopeptide (TPR) repeat protein